MKKMNVTFKGLLGFAMTFALAFMINVDVMGQSEFSTNPNVPDFMAAAAGKDMAAMNSLDLSGTNFLTLSQAGDKLRTAYDALAPVVTDPSTGAPIPGSLQYVKAVYYRYTLNGLGTGLDVQEALIEAFPQLATAAEDVPSADVMDIFKDTVDMVSF